MWVHSNSWFGYFQLSIYNNKSCDCCAGQRSRSNKGKGMKIWGQALTVSIPLKFVVWRWNEVKSSRRWNDDDEISFLVEETGVPGGTTDLRQGTDKVCSSNIWILFLLKTNNLKIRSRSKRSHGVIPRSLCEKLWMALISPCSGGI